MFTPSQKKELDAIADRLAREMAFTEGFNQSGYTFDEYVRQRLGDRIDDGVIPAATDKAVILYVMKQTHDFFKALAGVERLKSSP